MCGTREKLIELLKQIDGLCPKEGSCDKCEFYSLDDCYFPAKADFLISHGVTVSPIPVGSTVYALYDRNKCRHGVLGNRVHTRNAQITTNGGLKSAKSRGENIEIREKKANKQDALLLGRLVFLSKEDAERVIEDG